VTTEEVEEINTTITIPKWQFEQMKKAYEKTAYEGTFEQYLAYPIHLYTFENTRTRNDLMSGVSAIHETVEELLGKLNTVINDLEELKEGVYDSIQGIDEDLDE
jgi:hypothetical protein